MNKCARCGKTVYPTEETKCLDKYWHKGCFKCGECGMALNMKNYKGYNKMPYCNAHCPQAKHTTVADTPEMRRLADNTRIQSQVKYHEDFEKLKGKVTQVADDPETVRIRNASKMISNVAYHGELEKKKQMEDKRALLPEGNGVGAGVGVMVEPQPAQIQLLQHHLHQQPPSTGMSGLKQVQPSLQTSNRSRVIMGGDQNENVEPLPRPEAPMNVLPFDGVAVNRDNISYPSKQSTLVYSSDPGQVNEMPSRKIGSIADYDPLNDNYGSIASGYRTDQFQYSYGAAPQVHGLAANSSVQQIRRGVTPTFQAMYDYTAQDVDEVSFLDGDLIVNCASIDEGWMTGTVQRTGQTGMLPANYVQPFN